MISSKNRFLVRMFAVFILAITVTHMYAQTTEEKIADAMSAGSASIAENATIMDWPASEGAEMMVLREGTNGWVCYPSNPATLAAGSKDPMCLDEVWQAWLNALMTQTEPKIERTGIAYMFAGSLGSNTDPYAVAPTEDNEWHSDGPHLMVLVPDLSALEGVSSDYEMGGPYVMYPGSPFAHIMVPIGPHSME